MTNLQRDRLVKALVDGVSSYTELARLAEVDAVVLTKYAVEIDRAISLMDGFYKFGHENMKPAGLPPPKNPYYNAQLPMEEQSHEYVAYEAVQRGAINRERSIWTCGQFGLDAAAAETAIDNVIMPWREANGWRTYARLETGGRYVLQDKPPVKLKRHLERLLVALAEARD